MNVCDNTSVGVLIGDDQGRLLLFRRGRYPWGMAPVAGHVDGHGTVEDAARAEIAEEVGVGVNGLEYVAGGWRENRCRREPGPQGVGHFWTVYRAAWAGTVRATDEAKAPAWYTPAEIQWLADRTVAYAAGRVAEADWRPAPGLEPVWVRWLADLGIIRATADDLALVHRLIEKAGSRDTDPHLPGISPAEREGGPVGEHAG